MFKKYLPELCVLTAATSWGFMGLFTKFLLDAGAAPIDIVAIRNSGGLLLMALFFAITDRTVFHVKLRDLPIFFATGIVSVLFFTLCYFSCQQYCSIAVSAILLYTAPAMVVVMSALVFREAITKRKILALVLALLGCSFVTGIWSGGFSAEPIGIALGLGSAFFYALYTIFARFALKKYAPFAVVLWTFVFAGSGALALADRGAIVELFRTRPEMFLVGFALALVATALPYLFYTRGLSMMDGGKASILASWEPVVAAFSGIFFYGEPVSLAVFAGLACILGCVYILR